MPSPIPLRRIFALQERKLREYFSLNKARLASQRATLFYVIQNNGLQCLNGAYLSEVDEELGEILLGSDFSKGTAEFRLPIISVPTGESIQQLRARIGQQDFSSNVRGNYGHRCCFPGCTVHEDSFLIASHIARWADVPELRGKTGNGLCFCLMHDRAFERGMFIITSDLKVAVNKRQSMVINSAWCTDHLFPYEGQKIHCGKITPLKEALRLHWERTDFSPNLIQSMQ